MIPKSINGKTYRLPGSLTEFQQGMYIHLINYKQNVLGIKEPGEYTYKGRDIEYDAILPKAVREKYPLIFPGILPLLLEHRNKHHFKLHLHFNHMASSQAANVNLFLPVLLHRSADEIFKQLKPDFNRLAKDQLDHGFRIEYWDGKNKEKGLLGDHNARSGTDSDIAIAYYNHANELCLWLIAHKLTEKEFTTCGGNKSNDRDKTRHRCEKSFSEILENKELCFYHDFKKNEYWKITEGNQSFFINHKKHDSCPFKGGMNQLWRNQLLGLALEKKGPYQHVYFSVVHHPGNKSLNTTIEQYQDLINHDQRFSVFTSKEMVDIVKCQNDPELTKWADWYCGLYNIK